eukprot:3459990-Ditylum_brightwellii.AAC.1
MASTDEETELESFRNPSTLTTNYPTSFIDPTKTVKAMQQVDDSAFSPTPDSRDEDEYDESKCPYAGCVSQCTHSLYRFPLSPETVKNKMPRGKEGEGLEFYAKIVPDYVYHDGKLRFLSKQEFDFEKQKIKSRRSTLPVKSTDFFSSLVRIDDD